MDFQFPHIKQHNIFNIDDDDDDNNNNNNNTCFLTA